MLKVCAGSLAMLVLSAFSAHSTTVVIKGTAYECPINLTRQQEINAYDVCGMDTDCHFKQGYATGSAEFAQCALKVRDCHRSARQQNAEISLMNQVKSACMAKRGRKTDSQQPSNWKKRAAEAQQRNEDLQHRVQESDADYRAAQDELQRQSDAVQRQNAIEAERQFKAMKRDERRKAEQAERQRQRQEAERTRAETPVTKKRKSSGGMSANECQALRDSKPSIYERFVNSQDVNAEFARVNGLLARYCGG